MRRAHDHEFFFFFSITTEHSSEPTFPSVLWPNHCDPSSSHLHIIHVSMLTLIWRPLYNSLLKAQMCIITKTMKRLIAYCRMRSHFL